MEMVSPIVKAQLNRFIIEMGDSSMKKKTIIISGIAAVLVIGSVVFCFAVKGDGTQPAEVAQTVTEAVATPTIEIPEEVVEEPEVVEEVPEVQETTEEVSSIVDVAETSEEVSEDAGVSTQKEEVSSEQSAEPKQEEVKPAETKPVETQPTESKPVQTQPTESKPVQTTVDAQRDAIIAELKAMGAVEGVGEDTSVLGNRVSNVGLQWE